MHQLVIGNWKMHGTLKSATELASKISNYVSAKGLMQTKVVICPPALHVSEVVRNVAGSSVSVGVQDCHDKEQGAHTGNNSALMAVEAGAEYVILGHSERRAQHQEHDKLIAAKAEAAKAAGLLPVICIGETLEQRESGDFVQVLSSQVKESIPVSFSVTDYVLAYEPVWAIGTGKVADADTISATHSMLAEQLPKGAKILYGGSVKPDNAQEIMSINHVDGVLVGGASLNCESFNAIITAAEKV